MYRKTLVAAAVMAALTVPALAAAKTYYIEQSAKTHRCYVTSKKPNGKTMSMVGKTTYPTLAKAYAARKAAAVCKAKA
jgi:fructose-specific phosphotransferase system IIC component